MKNHNYKQIVIFLIGYVILDTEELRKSLVVSNQKLLEKASSFFLTLYVNYFTFDAGYCKKEEGMKRLKAFFL